MYNSAILHSSKEDTVGDTAPCESCVLRICRDRVPVSGHCHGCCRVSVLTEAAEESGRAGGAGKGCGQKNRTKDQGC